MQTLCRWIMAVKMNYRPIACHDWRRAVLTMQTLFVMFTVLYIRLFITQEEQEPVEKKTTKCDRNNEREKYEFTLTLINRQIDRRQTQLANITRPI